MVGNLKGVVQGAISAETSDIVAANTAQDVEAIAAKISDNVASWAWNDAFCYRAVVIILGIVVILVACAQAARMLGFDNGVGEQPIPEGLISLGAASIGALAGLLAPAPR